MAAVNLKLSPAEAKEETNPDPDDQRPLYPYGLCLYLDQDTLTKLGLTADIKIGTVLAVSGSATVQGTSRRQTQGGEDYASVDLQITDLGLDGAVKKSAAELMYGPAKPAPDAAA